jgi:hypothetical protein
VQDAGAALRVAVDRARKYAEELFDEPFAWNEGSGAHDVVQAHRTRYVPQTRTWCPDATVYDQLAQLILTERSSEGLTDICLRAGFPEDAVERAAASLIQTRQAAV